MAKAILLSLVFHGLVVAATIWSTHISFAVFLANREEIKLSGVVEVDLLYRPTETQMRRGATTTELPPPQVRTRTAAPQQAMPKPTPPRPTPPPKTPPPKQAQTEKQEEKPVEEDTRRQDMRALMAQMRQEQGMIAEQAPRERNFPTRDDGVEEGRGTGGTAQRQANPGQLALQTAMRKHFELPVGNRLKQTNPDALGFIRVRLVGVGNRFEIASLQVQQSSGFTILDRSCETAIRVALNEEYFSSDVISELTGKEELVKCQP